MRTMMNNNKSLCILFVLLFLVAATYLSYAQIPPLTFGCPLGGLVDCSKASASDVGKPINTRCAPDCDDCTDCNCVTDSFGAEHCHCAHSETRTPLWKCNHWRRTCHLGTTQASFGNLNEICSTIEGGAPAPVCETDACCCGCCFASINIFGHTFCLGWLPGAFRHGSGAAFPMARTYTISQLPYNDTGNCQAADGSRCRICEEVFCDVPVWNWGPRKCYDWYCDNPCSGCG